MTGENFKDSPEAAKAHKRKEVLGLTRNSERGLCFKKKLVTEETDKRTCCPGPGKELKEGGKSKSTKAG